MRAVTVTLVPLFCLLALTSCQSHDLVLGHASYGDVVLFKYNTYKYGFPFFVRTENIEYLEPGMHNFATIRALYVKDNDRDGSGGYATVKAGGIGQRFVNIKLRSQRGSGYNFTISVYGRYL